MNFSNERFSIFKNQYFLLGLFVKIAFLFFSGSEYLHNFFIPFIDRAILNFGQNPWSLSPPEYFPYGSFLFLCLYVPKSLLYLIFGQASLGSSMLSLFGIKISLFIFDLLLFWVLSRLAFGARDKVVFFYWLNPILFYITYVYGQLDVVSMSLCLASLFLLFKNRISWASVFFALSLASKFHVILLAPFIAAYLWNRFFLKEALTKILQSSLIVCGTFLIGFLPLYFSSHMDYATTSSPEALRIFSAKLIYNDQSSIFIGLLLVFLTLGRLIFSTQITQKGLIYGCGFLLGVLLLITDPMPGWYFWVVPFLALFYVHYPGTPRLLMLAIGGAYFNYFVFSPYLNYNIFFKNISLTLLQTSLLALLLVVYFIAIKKESPIRNRLKPILVGLGGDSGAGKNHISQLIQNILNPKNCDMIEGDNYHRWERGHRNWQNLTHLNPQANDLSKLHEHAKNISHGLSIEQHHYDHQTGRFTEPHLFNPAKTIIVQGLHSLYLKGLRESLDLKIFLNPSENVRLYWKIKRDVKERGHTLEAVLTAIEKRKADSLLHIQPQKEKSDWIIEIDWDGDFNWTSWNDSHSPSLKIKYTFYNDENLTELIQELQNHKVQVLSEYPDDGKDRVIVSVTGFLSKEQISSIAHKVFPNLRSLTRSRTEPQFNGGYDGFHQLFFLSLLRKRV